MKRDFFVFLSRYPAFFAMRPAFIAPLAACLFLLLPACRDARERAPEWESALRELDRSLAQEASLSQQHVADLADLKIQFKHANTPRARYRFCDRIFDGYLKYDVDSALRYAHLKEGSRPARTMPNSAWTPPWTSPSVT